MGKQPEPAFGLVPESKDSKIALDFIKKNVLELWEFDRLCENTNASSGWEALIGLMKRPWFSRRWVVQEIALANEGILYCGKEAISWQGFADAVSLFVEVETATHRLSEAMKKDQRLNHVPDFFDYVPAFGATLLVEATSNLFRRSKDGGREPLLSLEYLVSALSVFESSELRDTVYALLAIAKNTSPRAASERQSDYSISGQQLSAWGSNIASKPYHVDYQQPYIEICMDFITFSIHQSEQSRALDIICRPWAPQIAKENQKNAMGKPLRDDADDDAQQYCLESLPSWISSLDGAAFGMSDTPDGHKMSRENADPLVGPPVFGQRNYSAAGTKTVKLSDLKFKARKIYCSMYVEGFILDRVGEVQEIARSGNIPTTWFKLGGWDWESNKKDPPDPPEEFWRTAVANRGPKGHNAPTFYPRACKESAKKGMRGGTLDATTLINNGRCSIVAEFLRRVQAVIWNKRLMRTEPHLSDAPGRLGLVPEKANEGDLICILYGCSVPVVLREHEKSDDQIASEQAADEEAIRVEAAKTIQRGWRGIKRRRAERGRNEDQRRRNDKDKDNEEKWGRHNEKELNLIGFLNERTSSERLKLERTYQERLIDRMEVYHEQARNTSKAFRERATRILQQYQQFVGYVTPICIGVYIKYRRDVNLELMLIAAILGAAFIIAIFPSIWSLSPRWSMYANKWHVPSFQRAPKSESHSNVIASNHFYYQLIGDCYLHGMMDSEAIRYQNESGTKPPIFELR